MKKLSYAILRFIYTAWQWFWKSLLTLSLVVMLLLGGSLALLQIDKVKNFASDFIENQFNKHFQGYLSVGRVDGFIPFYLTIEDVRLTYSDSLNVSKTDTLLSVDSLAVGIDWTGLYRQKFSINYLILKRPLLKLKKAPVDTLYTLHYALERKKRKPSVSKTGEKLLSLINLKNMEILAPQVEIKDGTFLIEPSSKEGFIALPEQFKAENINITTFLEIRSKQRFLDIESLNIDFPNLFLEHVTASGQIFNDDRFLEFNGFRLRTELSQLHLNGEIDGFNTYKGNWKEQLETAKYDLELDSTIVYTSELSDILPALPVYNKPFQIAADLQGDKNSLAINNLRLDFNKSFIQIYGTAEALANRDSLAYDITLDESAVFMSDLQLFRNRHLAKNGNHFFDIESLSGSGHAEGTLKKIAGDLTVTSLQDTLESTFQANFADSVTYKLQVVGRNVNPGHYTGLNPGNSNLSFAFTAQGRGLDEESATVNLEGTVNNSQLEGRPIEEFFLFAELEKGFVEVSYKFFNKSEVITGDGWIDLLSSQPILNLSGNGKRFNLARYFYYPGVPQTDIDFTFSSQLQGTGLNNLYGSANIGIKPSVFEGDSVDSQQLRIVLNSPNENVRKLTLNSSLADIEIAGKLTPTHIFPVARQWGNYITRRVRQEIVFADSLPERYLAGADTEPLNLTAKITVNDISLLKKYFPSLPDLSSEGVLEANIQADKNGLKIDAHMQDDSLVVNNISIYGVQFQFNSQFTNGMRLQEKSKLSVSTDIETILLKEFPLKKFSLSLEMENDSLRLAHSIDSIGKNVRASYTFLTRLDSTEISSELTSFFAGNQQYAWQKNENPRISYMKNGRLRVQDFELQNRDERIWVDGTFSRLPEDSVVYKLSRVDLSRISELIDPAFSFQGILNGSFFTKTLTRQPVVAGEISVNRFAMNNRIVGDITFNSSFNRDKKRFDTNLEIITDETKYQKYLKENEGVGQRILVDGYFYPPRENVVQDTVYYFDVNMPEIDMWILPFIVQNVFERVEGVASGKGYITGNMDSFDFNAGFNVDSVNVNTVFLNTNYKLKGGITVDRHKGVTLDSLAVNDTKKGTGILYGNFDFNDFAEEKYFDLKLRMNTLSFLNTKFDRDVPFYGQAAGSGLVHLTGSNQAPLLSSVEPILVEPNSKIGIPLLEEITVQENTRAIQFVNSFENLRQKVRDNTVKTIVLGNNNQAEGEESRDFTEFFDLNLQFNAPQNITGEMIFDPISGEIITAQGIGLLQVLLQDGDLSLFGHFEIKSGQYNFVSGDVFTRRFKLQEGGTIRWEGDPENARLDINAIYRARPDVSTILGINGPDNDPSEIQRVPVELILEITGTVESVENDFSFRVPNSLESSQSQRVNDLETRLNRDNNKLLQATSLLLTGELVPVTLSTNQDATSALSSNFRNEGGSVVLSPLLSSQISNLLNNNISNLDFDLNMAGFDQIDLGIALRLFNDKLVLSREGQIGGAQNDIGNLEATYQLNNAFNIIAFHRQDPTFGSLNSNDAGQVIQSLNGLGIEAQFQFNSWSAFSSGIKKSFRSVFGITKNKDEDQEKDKNESSSESEATASRNGDSENKK